MVTVAARGNETLRVGRRTIAVSKLDKPLYPGDGITKADVIDYYATVADVMVPQVRDRLMTLERFPDGIGSERFFSKSIPKYFPDWIDRLEVPKAGGTVTHVVCNDKATLVYLANQACLTLHVGSSRVDAIDRPDQLVLDLDPPEGGFDVARRIAAHVRELLEDIGLVPFLKSTGSKGLHVVAPITPNERFDEVKSFARELAAVVADRFPDEVTIEQRKNKRGGRLFLDWFRTAYAQTVVAPYSLRARPGAPAAVPLEWDELRDRKLRPDRFTMRATIARVESGIDPWKGWRRRARSLAAPRKRLAEELGQD